jgi:hypothetical protein
VAGAEAPTARLLVEEAVRAAEAPTSAAGVSASAAAATTGAVVTPPEPSRKRKRGFSSLREVAFFPSAPNFEGLELSFMFCIRRVALTVPALAPAKALRSDASVPTRRRSSRAPRTAKSAVATSEPPRGVGAEYGPDTNQ